MRNLLISWSLCVGIAIAGILPRDVVSLNAKMPDWNFANETTKDATPDGLVGVIIEPDLVEGKNGKDGGVVSKVKFGPYKLGPGKTVTYNIVPAINGKSLPCKNCYITAMQQGLEYEDGKKANVDTGAWYCLYTHISPR
jgi:hypothetical protein